MTNIIVISMLKNNNISVEPKIVYELSLPIIELHRRGKKMRNIILNEDQQNAFNAIGQYKSLFISGGAGVGKSHLLSYIVKNDPDNSIVVCATTNQAARVLTEKIDTGIKIPTMHSVLGLRPDYDGSTKDANELVSFGFKTLPKDMMVLQYKTLIIDEASMICAPVQKYIMELLQHENLARVVFVGDKYQLPCVKNDPFNFTQVEHVVELTQVMRSEGALMRYHQKIRSEVMSNLELSMFEEATHFDSKEDFVNHINSLECSKMVISYTNQTAGIYSKLLDADNFYEGQVCSALSPCMYNHITGGLVVKIDTNSRVEIDKLFKNYRLMKRDALKNGYEYHLPNEPAGIDLSDISYSRVYNEENDLMYISIWNGRKDDKESVHLNKLSREYRKFQDRVRTHLNDDELWFRCAKADGYLQSLKPLKPHPRLNPQILQEEALYWNNFFAITNAVPLRSIISSTAHRAQGMTVDAVAIDYQDLSRSPDKRLLYVALTRAAKQLIVYTGEEHVQQAA
ncbi:UvrD-like helicase C-terminal domain-containing protein [Epsilonproteobacteria bacterium SCGC AD-308-E02]|nr:UvrD-like helicase C-terminal domain-containing protein [Epsilonproteobacteria bacterium SCGC AD-308-E02]